MVLTSAQGQLHLYLTLVDTNVSEDHNASIFTVEVKDKGKVVPVLFLD
jgi:hypothetical protein